MEQYKTCPKCGQTKPHSEWGRNRSKKDGLSSECKLCHAKSSAEWRKANPEEQKRRSREQHYKNRDKANAGRKQRYRANQDRERANRKIYYEATAEKQRESSRLWRKNNPEKLRMQNRRIRAQRASVPSEPYTTQDVLDKWGTKCHLCNEEIDLSAPRATHTPGWEMGLQLEHVIPISSNGPDTLDNVKPSHGRCNIGKGYVRMKD
jgi:hypothetical protein